MHEFATAADAIGHDEQAPLLQEQGRRKCCRGALNAMRIPMQNIARTRS